MKYKFTRAYKKREVTKSERQLIFKNITIAHPEPFRAIERNEEIDLFGVFDENEHNKEKTHLFARLGKALAKMRLKVKTIQEKRKPPIRASLLVGVFCGVLSVALITAAIVVYSIFGSYGGSYRIVTIPDLIGMSESDAAAVERDSFQYTIKYEYNPTRDAGSVISQSPAPKVERKLYSKDGKLAIQLTVNTRPPSTVLQSVVGMKKRDATLLLKNAGIEVTLIEEWSDTAPADEVTYCSFSSNEPLVVGQNVLLKVSKGKQIPLVAVPELCGLGEAEAVEKLSKLGLLVGEIKYEHSDLPIGRVISQQFSRGTQLAAGTSVSFSVSGGKGFG
jgi:beta-lactam-binding protein with PASTA domain